MRVTKFTHSCLRVEGAGVLVVDPGEFSEASVLDGADAVLITHEHFDHLDVKAVTGAVARRPDLRIFAHPAVLKLLTDVDEATTAVSPREEFEAAGYRIRAFGGQHAIIHPYVPVFANLGFLIDDGATNLYHPGDSFVAPDVAVETLFVPLNAPWATIAESLEFVRGIRPERAFALHDGLVNERGAAVYGKHLESFSETRFARVEPGSVLD
ncbi:MBL fold metallo-hydrolase [Actinoplanes lobatus]|uniref:L-ascorbate metabolism protein UlaG (Beta-lactamase superfamily) n=1 Tax=Actinoplanes lobatus TaxID=113568 RepID=A0A7W7HAX6_9ACTN|nr:MBL fold metallo-hydrolase [Actinoplanes lobatus]MBB4747179.1 L-ascorbate metabolism protein UlaG (beta-lactamase superfamily) [Actinoplanes lobatus]GGN56076.1 MBL fold metallo-hydrolase [Actinoplanes lobatus]GIE39254.1 MBL fold metallo-hydrolase [Actinoplanes lobatus]